MNPFGTLKTFEIGAESVKFFSLLQLETRGIGGNSRLPVSIRILLESVLRSYDGQRFTEENIVRLARWQSGAEQITWPWNS